MILCFIVSTEAEKTRGGGEEWCGAWFLFGIGCCDWVCLGFVNLSLRLLDEKMEQASVWNCGLDKLYAKINQLPTLLFRHQNAQTFVVCYILQGVFPFIHGTEAHELQIIDA